MRFPDLVLIDGLITGVVIGEPNGEVGLPDELWVASQDALGFSQLTWIQKSRLTKQEPPPPPKPVVMSGPSPEVNEMLRWIQHTAKIGYESAESGSQAETCLELIMHRMNSLFGQTSK